MDDIWSVLGLIVVPAFSAFAGALIAGHRFMSEQLWTQRRLAYSAIIAPISEASRIGRIMADGFLKDGPTYDDAPDVVDDINSYHQIVERGRASIQDNLILLSDAFYGRVSKFGDDIQKLGIDYVDETTYWVQARDVLLTARDDLLSIAKRDLGLDRKLKLFWLLPSMGRSRRNGFGVK